MKTLISLPQIAALGGLTSQAARRKIEASKIAADGIAFIGRGQTPLYDVTRLPAILAVIAPHIRPEHITAAELR